MYMTVHVFPEEIKVEFKPEGAFPIHVTLTDRKEGTSRTTVFLTEKQADSLWSNLGRRLAQLEIEKEESGDGDS